MKLENIKKSEELVNLLQKTKLAKLNIEKLLSQKNTKEKKEYIDGCYWLTIAEHQDGSGTNADLNRYFGNEKLLKVILKELYEQIKFFEEEIKSL